MVQNVLKPGQNGGGQDIRTFNRFCDLTNWQLLPGNTAVSEFRTNIKSEYTPSA